MAVRKRKPTKRQLDAYQFIAEYSKKTGYPPSSRELAAGLGITLRPAQKLVDALYLKGLIVKVPYAPRGIVLL